MKKINERKKNYYNYFLAVVFFSAIFLPFYLVYATFSCSITTSSGCSGITLLRMSGSANAHAELPTQSTGVYDNNVVCCTGITGLGNSCAASNKSIFARMSGVTNAHVEKNSETGVNYTQNACLSSKAGDIITVGYQTTNCTGYDTTLFSMGSTPTNSMVGIPSSYTNKVCASVFSASLTFDISTNAVPLGVITSSTTGKGSHTAQISTNAQGGFALTYNGPVLTSTGGTITAYGSQASSVAGIEGFGINMVDNATPDIGANVVQNAGVCASIPADYGTVDKYSYSPNITTLLTNQSTPADCTYTMSYVSNISSVTPAGNYTAPITYIVTGTF